MDMKKITLAIVTSFLGITHAHSAVCEYKFDATTEQVIAINQQPGNPQALDSLTIGRFPQQSGSKVSFKLTASNTAFMAFNSKQTNALKDLFLGNSTVAVGDQIIPSTGIVAFEFNFKVPNALKGKGKLLSFPIMISGKSQDNKQTSIFILYMNNPDETNTTNFLGTFFQHDQSSITPENFSSPLDVQNTLDGYQRMGIYINQSTNQVGLIFNHQNYGYIGTLPSKLDNLFFMIPVVYSNIASSDLNQEVSIELVTDKSKFKNTYPTGTKDICGN